ncbi:Hypothetical protein BRZCDTV_256 [Brazilian cedratvirus IHUMI]|uniref:Uncharacterized protein n=1 Tax=Brazilian cedratvirus IHUMI TaxID=2126980 RepID=A0A2R8FE70_9VIRU|nr:Hypothetical protein BRZCDTV_256 [Brazilian cedratvirus IHUMI]
MQAVTFLEEKIREGKEEYKVTLLEAVVREEDNWYIVEEVDKEEICSLLQESYICETQLGKVLSSLEEISLASIQEELKSISDYVEQLRFLVSPVLCLVIRDDKFFYKLGKYKKEISQENVLLLLERSFARGDHCYP